MKNVFSLFVGLLVLTMSSLAYADPDNPNTIFANDVNDIVANMGPSDTVWIQGTNSEILLYDNGMTDIYTVIPENSEGMIIGGAGVPSQIKAITNDLNNIQLTRVLSDGSMVISGKANTSDEFVITNTLKEAVLGATDDINTVGEDDDGADPTNANSEEDTDDSENNVSDDDNGEDIAVDSSADDDTTGEDTKNPTTEKKIVKKIVKKQKPKHNTGFPVAVLVVAVFAAAFVPFARKK